MNQLQKPIDLDALPKWKARVEIAKDVIAAVKAGKLETDHVYINGRSGLCKEGPQSLRDLLPNAQCSVCAIGACFVASVARRNQFEVDVGGGYFYVPRAEMLRHLRPFFSEEDLAEIECAYEECLNVLLPRCRYDAAIKFGGQYEDDAKRLIAIMKNIVRNRGTFRPELP